jgi:AAA ATPase domain
MFQGGISQISTFSVSFSLSEVSEAPYFVAREKEIADIHTVLQTKDPRRIIILHGMGGIGKTQITISYAKRHQSDHSAIFWLNCKDEDSLRQSFLRAAKRIAQEYPSGSGLSVVNNDSNLDEVVDTVKRWLDRKGNIRWLLIYDNYDNPKLRESRDPLAFDIKHYFPDADHGSIIITTRRSEVDIGHRSEIRKLEDIQDSLRILSLTSGRSNVMDGKSQIDSHI